MLMQFLKDVCIIIIQLSIQKTDARTLLDLIIRVSFHQFSGAEKSTHSRQISIQRYLQ